MKIFDRVRAAYRALTSVHYGRGSWLSAYDAYGYGSTSGETVNQSTTMSLSAAFACLNVLSRAVASLPWIVYERGPGDTRRRATTHPLYNLLQFESNPYMSSYVFRQTMMYNLALRGNACAEIVRDGAGRVVSLVPWRPANVRYEIEGNEVRYYVLSDSRRWIEVPAVDVFHLRGISDDGLIGVDPLDVLKNVFGVSLSAEAFGARFFKNGAKPSGVLEYPGKGLTPEARVNLRDSWQSAQGGANQHKVALLEGGTTYKPISHSNEESQFLETRKFQITEIARIFNVPPHMIQDLERATFSNIEHQEIFFDKRTLGPWVKLWEQEAQRRLISPARRNQYYTEFLFNALQRADIITRYNAYNIGRNGGWLSVNEIRGFENLNPVPGGDEYLTPLNMSPVNADPEPTLDVKTPTIDDDERSRFKTKKLETLIGGNGNGAEAKQTRF